MTSSVLLALATPAFAATVSWQDPGTLEAGQRATLDLVFDGTEPDGAIAIPHLDGITFLGSPSQQSNVTVVNGKVSATATLSYPIRAEREGEVTVPPFQIETSDGPVTVKSIQFEVAKRDASARHGNAASGEAVTAELKTATRQPYAGQVFDVDLTVGLAAGRRGEIVGAPSWDKPGVVTEAWGEGKRVNRGNGAAVRMSTRAMAPKAGEIELPPVRQDVRVDAGAQRARRNPFGRLGDDMFADMDRFFDDSMIDSLFGRANLAEATVESNSADIDVRPLPQPAPAGFNGAVGEFVLESKLVPAEAKTGEPVTWTLTLRGDGNWPGGVSLPARAVPANIKTLQPKQQRQFEENSLFTGAVSEDIVLIPTQPGTYELEPVRFTYFDPHTGKYETTVVEPPALHVTGAAIAASAGAGVAPGSSSSGASEDKQTTNPPSAPPSSSLVRATSPETPPSPVDARLPHEPQAGVGVARAPLPRETWLAFLGAPFALLAIFWLALGLRHAFRTDPKRRRREALKHLRHAIESARAAADGEGRRIALLAWQHAAATILEIDFAAPTPAHLRQRGSIETDWISLWSQSDRALYGRDTVLADGWCERALDLCRRLKRPWRNPFRAVLPGNLLPKAAAAALLLTAAALSRSAHATASEDYAQGDFAAARNAWKSEVEATPADWVARYNLGVAEAQLGDTGRALGETAAAFLRQPTNADVRWNLNAFAARVPGIDRVLARFAAEDGGVDLARQLSPAAWQIVAIASAFLFCLGAAFALHQTHSARSIAPASIVALGVGAVVTLGAWACLHQYGHLASPRAALLAQASVLRSIPTDAESSGQQHPVAPGAVVEVEKNFLGWSKVTLPGGESGWVRGETLVPLYS